MADGGDEGLGVDPEPYLAAAASAFLTRHHPIPRFTVQPCAVTLRPITEEGGGGMGISILWSRFALVAPIFVIDIASVKWVPDGVIANPARV
ncbi:hypothetical protein [Sphingomonas koreensis]|uniref:hypothetical protein n=1 Tax=Sphingomonas koreensis TaxID=93064 RepID=UPI0013DE6892|nr:hypothetical protein [Sphingomonas koreensis]MDC7809037.1 hypothetical protein [Sphingomonas koreensis]